MTHPRRHGRRPNKRRASDLGPRAATAFARLVRVMETLRSPDGCPWDREQTHASLRPHLLEETYEAIETIDRGDFDALPAELGDVLFQCSVGRTDFPYGDGPALIASIRRKLLPLGDDIAFLCGHGPGSTFGRERLNNPFVRGAAG